MKTKIHFRCVILVILSVTALANLRAENAETPPQNIFNIPDFKMRISVYAQKQAQEMDPTCVRAVFEGGDYVPIKLLRLDSKYGIPVDVVRAKLLVDQCGTQVIHNALLWSDEREKIIHFFPLAPGKTKADIQLQADITSQIIQAAMLSINCERDDGLTILDTRVLDDHSLQSDNIIDEGWQEEWLIRACATRVSILVTFKPDGQGGSYYYISQNR